MMWVEMRSALYRTMGWDGGDLADLPRRAEQALTKLPDGEVRPPMLLFAVSQEPMERWLKMTVSALASMEVTLLQVDAGLRAAQDGDLDGLSVIEGALRGAEAWLWPEPEEE